jgi:hypothetical protein
MVLFSCTERLWHLTCCTGGMMNLVLGAVLLLMAGAAFAFYAAFKAPVGYEDETGFHHGPATPEPVADFNTAVPQPAR